MEGDGFDGLREKILVENHGDENMAALDLATALMADDPETFKSGYSLENAIIAAREVFPSVSEDDLRLWLLQKGNE